MSKIFHCRCAVAIKFANRDKDTEAKIIAFDESHIDDVRVQLSGFNTPVGVVSQGNLNPSFSASRYAQSDSTVSVTINETALDASWLSLLDVAYTAVGGKAIDLAKNGDKFQSIYDVYATETPGTTGNKKVSDPEFLIEKNKKLILEAQGRGLKPVPTQSQHTSFVNGIKDEESFRSTIKGTLKNIETKDPVQLKTQKDNLSVILTIGKKLGLEPELGGGNPPSVSPPTQRQSNPPQRQAIESYGKIVFTLDHSLTGGGAGADGKERTLTDRIARYLKEQIERKEPKIKVEIKGPEDVVKKEYRICDKKRPGGGCKKDPECNEYYDSDWDEYDDYIVKEYVRNKEAKATIIGVHLDAPVDLGGSGAAVYNLNSATEVSNKLSNVINGTYISKFKQSGGNVKVNGVKRWNKCKNRSVRLYRDAPEGYSLIEFGVFREVQRIGFDKFIKQQKEAFDALVDGLIQFKKSFGSSTEVPASSSSSGSSDSGQLKLPEIGPKPGLLVSFWYEVNGYVSKVDYYFIITSASISFGDGTPKLNLGGNSAFSVVFNTWKIQDSFTAGTPVDEALRKIFNSDPTNTFSSGSVQFDKENPKERLYQQEDVAGLTYGQFISKLARKFDLQYLSSARTDQLGKIKIFRETRGGSFDGSQVFWLGRGLFEKYEISVVSDLSGFALVGDQTSNYSQAGLSGSEASGGSPFLASDKVNFKMPSGQPSMLHKVNGREYVQSTLPPPGWEGIERGERGIQVVLKLPDGRIWPSSGDLELHAFAQVRPGRYGTPRAITVWDANSKTFKIKTGNDIHPATDGGLFPDEGPTLISYFKGIVVGQVPGWGGVTIKYSRWIKLEINGEEKESQLYHRVLHMRNVIKTGSSVDVGTKIGNQSSVGASNPHMHEEFFITTGGKTLYLDPFIVYNYSYSKDSSGKVVFDSSARVGTVQTGQNNPGSGYQSGTKTGQGNTLVLRTEFRGIPRALQILPGQTFLHFVTDYNRYLTTDDKNKKDVDPGIPIIKQLQDWMIVKCSFNWSGDLRIDVEAHRPRSDSQIYNGQNWQHYRLNPGKGGPALEDYYDYIRSIGDLSYRTVDENGDIISSFNSKLKNVEWMTGYSGGSSSSNASGGNPSMITGKCKYTGNRYKNDKRFIDEVAAQLERAGLNKIAIAGIIGNTAVESTLGKNIVGEGVCNGGNSQKAKNESGADVLLGPNDCWGIVQWGGGRRASALRASNFDGRNIAGQASFIVQELRTTEKNCGCEKCSERGKNLIDLLNNAQTPENAARIFRVCYERPSADDSQKRQEQARIIFQGLTCE